MKFKSFTQKSIVLIVLLQFLNVDVQRAFATEAIQNHSPEAVQTFNQMKQSLTQKLSGSSEKQIIQYAFKRFKKAITRRNRYVSNNKTFEKLPVLDAEEQELFSAPNLVTTQKSISGDQSKDLLSKVDAFLCRFGATLDEGGNMSVPNLETFQEKLFNTEKSELSRDPSGINYDLIIKIVLCTLVISVSFVILIMVGVMISFGGASIFVWIFGLIELATDVFAIKGINNTTLIPSGD